MLGSHGRRGKNIPETEAFAIPFVIKWGKKLRHRAEDLILSVPDVMPTLLGLAGLQGDIPDAVQGTDYSSLLTHPQNEAVERPTSALFLQHAGRGVYTGRYTFVVQEESGQFKDAFCYDNQADPYQLQRIPVDEMEESMARELKTALYGLLKATNDRWYREGVCAKFFADVSL